MKSSIFIQQQTEEENLYTQLQKKTLDEIQRLSGEVWTDYNAHDPGITTADLANYLLSEFDYKLGFNLCDYLTDEKGHFNPEKYGLFLPEKVYPTTPVTLDDYQKLLLSEFPNLNKVSLSCDTETGNYHAKVELSPFEGRRIGNLEENIRKCFNANRNLCEKLDSVTIYTPPLLYFHSEFEIYPGEDATGILAQVYWKIIQYLSGSVRIEYSEERIFSNLSLEKCLEGATGNVRVIIPEQSYTIDELYKILHQIKGIKSIKSCYLTENEKDTVCPDFKKGYSLYIPKHQSEFNVRIKIDHSKMPINVERFGEELQALYFSKRTFRSDNQRVKEISFSNTLLREGAYRNIFWHRPMAKDFPKCYGLDAEGSNEQLKMFESYLSLYDLLILRGLTELNDLKNLCSIENNNAFLPEMEIVDSTEKGLLKSEDLYKNIPVIKNEYLDFLDNLYGINSNPSWMAEFSFYGESENDRIERRMKFLLNTPYLTKTRSKARNIYGEQNAQNIPTIKAYLSYLLNMNTDESISVGNILPSHNLILLGDNNENKQWRDKINSMLVNERMMDVSNIEKVIPDIPPKSEIEKSEKYLELRHDLPIFNSNLISGGLFRWGINLDNYKLVHMEGREYLLAFWNQEDSTWMNLGRSADKQKLNEWANTLSRYLMELNHQCEVVYVVEHNLFYPVLPFTVSFVFSNWTTRFKSSRLREICGQLIKSLLPAHIKANIYWLDVSDMQYFEDGYRKWSKALSEDYPQRELEVLQKDILDVFEAEDKKNKT